MRRLRPIKPIDDFHRSARHEDGRQSSCKSCRNAALRAWRLNAARTDQNYAKSTAAWVDANRDRVREWKRQWRRQNPGKVSAQNLLGRAVERGEILRPETCGECGNGGRIEAHHDDYAKALDVRWLCPPCHGAEHRRLRGEMSERNGMKR